MVITFIKQASTNLIACIQVRYQFLQASTTIAANPLITISLTPTTTNLVARWRLLPANHWTRSICFRTQITFGRITVSHMNYARLKMELGAFCRPKTLGKIV